MDLSNMEAIGLLKTAFTLFLFLIYLNNLDLVEDTILAVDASLINWEEICVELVKKKKHLFWYKSQI